MPRDLKSGSLTLQLIIGSDGRVREAMATKSAGGLTGAQRLAIASFAQKNWLFRPGKGRVRNIGCTSRTSDG